MDYLNTIDGDAFAIDKLERGVAYGTWRSRPGMPASIDGESLVEMLDPDPEPLGAEVLFEGLVSIEFFDDEPCELDEDECDVCGAGPDEPCYLVSDDSEGQDVFIVGFDAAGPLVEGDLGKAISAEQDTVLIGAAAPLDERVSDGAGGLVDSEDVFGPDAGATRARIDALEDQVAELELDRDLLLRVVRVNALVTHRHIADPSDTEFLRVCVDGQAPVEFTYTDRDGEVTERVVSPYEVKGSSRAALLIGRCHLRGELRAFRVDRMDEIDPSMEHFQGGEGE